MGNSILEQEVFLFSGYKNKKWSTTKVVIGRPQKMLEQTTLEVIAVNDHRKCYRGDHTTVIVIMPYFFYVLPYPFLNSLIASSVTILLMELRNDLCKRERSF